MRMLMLSVGVACVSLASGFAHAQRTSPARCQFEQTYDRFKDQTTLSVKFLSDRFSAGGRGVSLDVYQVFKGTQRLEPVAEPVMRFVSLDTGPESEWRYIEDHSLTLLVDKERIPLTTRHDSDMERLSGLDYALIEHVWASLKPEQVALLAKAQAVEGRLGKDEFTLDAAHRAGLAEFAALVADAARDVPLGYFPHTDSAATRPKTADPNAPAETAKEKRERELRETIERRKQRAAEKKARIGR